MQLPHICRVDRNAAHTIRGAYLDSEYVLHLFDGGSWQFTLPDTRFEATPAQLVLLPPRTLHQVEPLTQSEDGGHLVVHFAIPGGEHLLDSLPRAVTLPKGEIRTAHRLFHRLQSSTGESPTSDPWMRNGILLQMLALYRARSRSSVEVKHRRDPGWHHVQRALRLMHENLSDADFSLGELSDAAHLSHAHFCRIFRRTTGLTPLHYLTQLRLRRAQQLLLHNPDLDCSEIASRCGFPDLAGFSRSFKRELGLPPTRWRREQSE